MLNVTIDLVKEFEKFILIEIQTAQNMGFKFDEYNEWGKKEIIRMELFDNFSYRTTSL